MFCFAASAAYDVARASSPRSSRPRSGVAAWRWRCAGRPGAPARRREAGAVPRRGARRRARWAPMPSASVPAATSANPGARRIWRPAWRASGQLPERLPDAHVPLPRLAQSGGRPAGRRARLRSGPRVLARLGRGHPLRSRSFARASRWNAISSSTSCAGRGRSQGTVRPPRRGRARPRPRTRPRPPSPRAAGRPVRVNR